VGLLDSSGRGGALPGCLGGQLLPGGLASGRLTGRLLGTSHLSVLKNTDINPSTYTADNDGTYYFATVSEFRNAISQFHHAISISPLFFTISPRYFKFRQAI
jgi:hypothetical protein